MKELIFENLAQTIKEDDGSMTLLFDDGKKVISVSNVHAPEAETNEFYWDDEENVEKAVENASLDDVEME